ncbi:hypothetical protein HMN09_00289600 [Mycena chlorophos]|uniref:Uncharacterized protein n=1 Tax=Mycena chlorophos TaxID=658473 RepID=A0A8H6TID8_MYCCL|nr:hypothetical protein HMN09_00289600 [Mycena chlorophos]
MDKGLDAERELLRVICCEYNARIHWTAHDLEDPPLRDWDPDAVIVPETLPPEEQAEKDARLKVLSSRIQRWYRYRVQRTHSIRRTFGCDPRKDPFACFILRLSGYTRPKKRRQGYQQFMREHWDQLLPVIDQYWDDYKSIHANLARKGHKAGFRAQVVRPIFDALPEEEREGYVARAKEECDAQNAEYNAALRRAPDLSPEGIEKVLGNVTDFAGEVIQEIHKNTTWHATLLYGGPDPSKGGRISVRHLSIGRNRTARQAHWGNWDEKRFQQVLQFFGEYLQTAFTPAECSAAALPDSLDKDHGPGLFGTAQPSASYASRDSDSGSSDEDDDAEDSEGECPEDYDDDPFFNRAPGKRTTTATARQPVAKRRKTQAGPAPAAPPPMPPPLSFSLPPVNFPFDHARRSTAATPSPSPLANVASSWRDGDESSEVQADTNLDTTFSFGSAPMLPSFGTWAETTTPVRGAVSPTPSAFSSLAGAVPDIEQWATSPAPRQSAVTPISSTRRNVLDSGAFVPTPMGLGQTRPQSYGSLDPTQSTRSSLGPGFVANRALSRKETPSRSTQRKKPSRPAIGSNGAGVRSRGSIIPGTSSFSTTPRSTPIPVAARTRPIINDNGPGIRLGGALIPGTGSFVGTPVSERSRPSVGNGGRGVRSRGHVIPGTGSFDATPAQRSRLSTPSNDFDAGSTIPGTSSFMLSPPVELSGPKTPLPGQDAAEHLSTGITVFANGSLDALAPVRAQRPLFGDSGPGPGVLARGRLIPGTGSFAASPAKLTIERSSPSVGIPGPGTRSANRMIPGTGSVYLDPDYHVLCIDENHLVEREALFLHSPSTSPSLENVAQTLPAPTSCVLPTVYQPQPAPVLNAGALLSYSASSSADAAQDGGGGDAQSRSTFVQAGPTTRPPATLPDSAHFSSHSRSPSAASIAQDTNFSVVPLRPAPVQAEAPTPFPPSAVFAPSRPASVFSSTAVTALYQPRPRPTDNIAAMFDLPPATVHPSLPTPRRLAPQLAKPVSPVVRSPSSTAVPLAASHGLVDKHATPVEMQGVAHPTASAAARQEIEQQPRRSKRHAVGPGSRPSGPRAACPDEAAPWFRARYQQLTKRSLGLEFDALITAWVHIETQSLFRSCEDKLSQEHCPQQLLKWHRSGGKGSPNVARSRLSVFMAEFREWWDALQPTWRKKDVRGRWKRVSYGGSGRQWGKLFTWGDDGFDRIVAGLYMWGCSAEPGSAAYIEWGIALADAIWIFEGIAAHYAEYEKRGNW